MSKGAYYIFQVNQKKPAVAADFEKLKDQVARDYKMQKSQAVYQTMIEESLSADDVKLFPERIN